MYKKLKGKKLLFLGAVRPLCEAVEYAKSMGIYTIVIDYLPNSPAKKYADASYLVSTTDVDAVVELCKKEKVDGIFTAFTDSMLPYAREICDRLNLPFYATKEQIKLSLDKKFFKSVCEKYEVSVPIDYSKSICDGKIDFSKINYPVIVKPIDSSGGRGIRICYTDSELESAYEYALSVSPSKNVLIEEYVVGDEVTATYTMSNGIISLSCLKDKLISQDHENTTSLADVLLCPSSYLDLYKETVHPYIVKMLKGLNAKDGSVFFQGIANKEKIVIFECGYRINGACDYRLIEQLNNINYMKMMIAHALTGDMGLYNIELDNAHFSEYVLNFNIWAHGGVIGHQNGLAEVLKLDGVVMAEYMHNIGDKIIDNNTLAQRVFRAVIKSSDIEKIIELVKKIQSLVKVTDEEGCNMLFKPFNTNRLIERYKK